MSRAIWLLLDSRDLGGIETHVLLLAKGLTQAGREALILFWADHGCHPLAPEIDAAGLARRTLGGRFRDLTAALQRERPALLHTHGYKAGILGRAAARLCRVPVVSTFHSGEPGTGRLRLYFQLDRLTSRLGGRIAVSAAIAVSLPAPVTILPSFVELPRDSVLEFGARDTIGFVGRLSPEKGPDLFAALAERLPDLAFAFYGDGPDRAALEARWGARIRFHGRVVPMAPHWSSLALLAMPSRHEGLPLAALEAMANGVPVAGFAVGGLPDLIEPGIDGLLAPSGDLEALAALIRDWSGWPLERRLAMGRAARSKIESRYSLAAGIAALLPVYRGAGAVI
jgi:glycosyltransferase involved in cell wall biosynthesis